MKKILLTVCVAVASLLVIPGIANGQVPGQDSATGRGTTNGFTFDFSALSGPSGETPTGQAAVACCGASPFIQVVGPVTCLAVSGARAVIGVRDTSGSSIPFAEITVEDGGPGETDRLNAVPLLSPPDCIPVDTQTLEPLTSGGITVTDAQPFPTSKDQCKKNGWRNYPGFKNQGDCVSFVATGGKKRP